MAKRPNTQLRKPMELQFLARNTVFFIKNVGILHCGHVVPEVVPVTQILSKEEILQNVVINPLHCKKMENVLSRTFLLCGHSSLKKVSKTSSAIAKLGFLPLVVNTAQKSEIPVSCGASVVFLLYHPEGLSPKSELEVRTEVGTTTGAAQRFISIFADHLRKVTMRGPPLHICEYDPATKPLKHKLADSLFYMEKWSLLSKEEKIWRCVFTVCTLPTLVLPLFMLASYCGLNNDNAYEFNLLRWQKSQYAVRSSHLELASDKKTKATFIDIATGVCRDLGYYSEEDALPLTPSSTGTQISLRDNLLFVAGWKELNMKSSILRCMYVFVVASVVLLRLAQLILQPAGDKFLIASCMSYCVLAIAFAAFAFVKHKPAKAVGLALMVCSLMAAIGTGYVLLISPSAHTQMLQSETCVSAFMFIVAAVLLLSTLCVTRYYDKDRKVAKTLGISTTTYLGAKQQIHKALEAAGLCSADARVRAAKHMADLGMFGEEGEASAISTAEEKIPGKSLQDLQCENVVTETQLGGDGSASSNSRSAGKAA